MDRRPARRRRTLKAGGPVACSREEVVVAREAWSRDRDSAGRRCRRSGRPPSPAAVRAAECRWRSRRSSQRSYRALPERGRVAPRRQSATTARSRPSWTASARSRPMRLVGSQTRGSRRERRPLSHQPPYPFTSRPFFSRCARTRSRSSPCNSMVLSVTAPPQPHAFFSSPHNCFRKPAFCGKS